MQAHNRKGFYPVDTSSAKIRKLPVATTQTLARGDMVILSSGQIAIALASSAELCGVMAQDSVLATAAALVEVYADPETVFVGRADAALSLANAFSTYNEIDITGATGAMQLDADASSTNALIILEQHDTSEDLTAAGTQWCVKINKHAFANTSS